MKYIIALFIIVLVIGIANGDFEFINDPTLPPGMGAGNPSTDALLIETGHYLLLETGDYLLLE